MSDFVTDTHTMFWYLTAAARLGGSARAALQEAEHGRGLIYIPSIVIAELYYLNVKYGRPLNFTEEYRKLATAAHIRFIDFRAEDVLQFDALASIPEMHDRIIAGVAWRLSLPCLTRDPALVHSGLIQTVW